MQDFFMALLIGFVEGITEFLPISSTGHLLLLEHLTGRKNSELFNVVIQIGAVLAVIPLFKERIKLMTEFHKPESRDLTLKVMSAFVITGVGGLILKKLGLELPDSILPIAIALIVGGLVFIGVEIWQKDKVKSDNITWGIVAAMAIGQLIAASFPGASRSGTTIMLMLIVGLSRVRATEFSFLVGIPTMLAAGAYEVLKSVKSGAQEDWVFLGMTSLVSAITAFIAVKWLLKFVQTHTFISFGIYRIVLSVVLFGGLAFGIFTE